MAEQDMAEDSRFVDHIETKLLSPVKESWTPTKGFFREVEDSNIPNSESYQKSTPNKQDYGMDRNGEHEIKENGLEEEKRSNDYCHEHFIDRQESLIESSIPDTIESPVKVVDRAFNFINSEADSLDAVNNNSDTPKSCADMDKNDINNANFDIELETNQYLGKEVILHGDQSNQLKNEISNVDKADQNNEKDQASGVSDASVNLYWYSSNLEIDPAELEAFKQSQNVESYTSTLNVSFQDGYYKDKLGTSDKMDSQELHKLASSPTRPAARDAWSPAFESVSSHCLDVASALKSEPKTKKNNENVSIKEAGSSHPWGLERETKVIEKSKATDELPSIDSEFSADLVKVEKESIKLDDPDGAEFTEIDDKDEIKRKVFETELKIIENPDDIKIELDESDAIGYMELSDKEVIKQNIKNIEEQQDKKTNINAGGSSSEGSIKETQDKLKGRDLDLDMDESDAVGYIELKDKDDTMRKMEVVNESGKNVDNQNDSKNAIDNLKTEQVVEEVISFTETNIAFSANTGSSITMKTTERYAQDISKQIVTSVAKHIDDKDSKTIGVDQPDGSRSPVEETIECKVQKVTKTALKSFDIKSVEIYKPLEVKRKFNLSSETENKIKELGGKLINTEMFVDEYLDDSFYSILLHDCWLRLRNKEFQMKMKSSLHGNHNSYPETSTESEIKEVIGNIFKKVIRKKEDILVKPLDVIIDEIGLNEFVTIETTRKTYQLNEFVVDIDVASLGAGVGDISVVIERPGKIVPQLQQLDHLAKQIGMMPLQSA